LRSRARVATEVINKLTENVEMVAWLIRVRRVAVPTVSIVFSSFRKIDTKILSAARPKVPRESFALRRRARALHNRFSRRELPVQEQCRRACVS